MAYRQECAGRGWRALSRGADKAFPVEGEVFGEAQERVPAGK